MTNLTFAARRAPAAALCVVGSLMLSVAAAPAAAQEQPDFTGVWTTYRSDNAPPGAGAAAPRQGELPLTPAGQAAVDEFERLTAGTDYSPGAYCVGSGMPGSMLGSGGYPMEIIQRPEQITVIYEAHSETRRIFVGDRAAEINADDVFPERNGFSVARWEGDALVVETDHLVEQVDSRYPHSDQASIVERYTLSQEGDKTVLTAEMTMTDPLFLTEPYAATKKWQQVPAGRLMNYECTEPQWLDAIEHLKAGESPPLPLGAEPADNSDNG